MLYITITCTSPTCRNNFVRILFKSGVTSLFIFFLSSLFVCLIFFNNIFTFSRRKVPCFYNIHSLIWTLPHASRLLRIWISCWEFPWFSTIHYLFSVSCSWISKGSGWFIRVAEQIDWYRIFFFFFFLRNKHTPKKKKERGFNTNAYHNFTQKLW